MAPRHRHACTLLRELPLLDFEVALLKIFGLLQIDGHAVTWDWGHARECVAAGQHLQSRAIPPCASPILHIREAFAQPHGCPSLHALDECISACILSGTKSPTGLPVHSPQQSRPLVTVRVYTRMQQPCRRRASEHQSLDRLAATVCTVLTTEVHQPHVIAPVALSSFASLVEIPDRAGHVL